MRLVAIDPGVVSGVAYFEDRLLKKVAVVEAPAPNTRNRMGVFYDRMQTLLDTIEGATVTLEDMALNFRSGGQARSEGTLHGVRTLWELAAYKKGFEIRERVNPRTWQALIGLTARGVPREIVKDQAERHVALLYPEVYATLKPLSQAKRQAVVDAILIGLAALAGDTVGTSARKPRRGRRR